MMIGTGICTSRDRVGFPVPTEPPDTNNTHYQGSWTTMIGTSDLLPLLYRLVLIRTIQSILQHLSHAIDTNTNTSTALTFPPLGHPPFPCPIPLPIFRSKEC